MAKARAIVKRRKAVQNIRKITRTMELIATARFKKALDRATEAEAYTRKIAELVADLGSTAAEVSHPLLENRAEVKQVALAGDHQQPRPGRRLQRQRVLRGHAAGAGLSRPTGSKTSSKSPASAGSPTSGTAASPSTPPTPSSRTGPSSTRSRARRTGTSGCTSAARSTGSTSYTPVHQRGAARSGRRDALADDRARRSAEPGRRSRQAKARRVGRGSTPEAANGFRTSSFPTRKSILEEIVPVSFKVRLFKCFLDAAVSEQIAADGRHAGSDRERRRHDQDRSRGCTTAPARRRSPASWPRSSAARRHWNNSQPSPRASTQTPTPSETAAAAPRGASQFSPEVDAHGHRDRDRDRTDRPGDRLDLRRRVRRRAPARDLQRLDGQRRARRASRST